MRTASIALVALCLAAPLAARAPRAPRPASNPGTWIVTDDYPASALRTHTEGVVKFSLAVGADGVPRDCEVTASSGDSALDAAACAAVLKRGRFTAATDARGRNVAGTWSNTVRWQIPAEAPRGPATAPPPGFVSTVFTVETDGSVTDCEVEKSDGALAAGNMCGTIPKMRPILDSHGQPVRKRVRMVLSVEYSDPEN